jgi:hypothetical protein
MPRLRSPVLLRWGCNRGQILIFAQQSRSDPTLRKNQDLTPVALFAAQSLFLWMFLAADPLEELADAGAFGPGARDAAYAFAAAWRHGMAGNSPLYMPGFFAVAAATWVWSEREPPASRWSRVRSVLLALLAAITVTLTAVSLDPTTVVASFEQTTMLAAREAARAPRQHALVVGLYTLATWSAFVVGSRLALARRSLLPLAPVPVLTAGLVAIRPWTVDDFTATWGRRSLEGDPVAIGSLVAVLLLAIVLVARERARRSR